MKVSQHCCFASKQHPSRVRWRKCVLCPGLLLYLMTLTDPCLVGSVLFRHIQNSHFSTATEHFLLYSYEEVKTPTYVFHINNKKVLLRERKRHTARRVVSTPYVVLPGYPPPGGTQTSVPPRGGTQTSVPPLGGYPGGYPDLGTPPGGYPDLGTPPGGVPGPRYPPSPRGVPGGVPRPRYPPGGTQTSVPPPGGVPRPRFPPRGGTRTPPPPPVWTDKQSETITFPSYYVRGR